MTEDGVTVELDPADLRQLLKAIKDFDPKLATATRRRIRDVGKQAVSQIQAEILKSPPGGGGGKSKNGVRRGLAAGTKVAILTGVKRQGVRIQTSSAQLAEAQRPMLRAYNKASFRHRVYGSDTFVKQEGRPYFGTVIRRYENQFSDAVEAALKEAIDQMGSA